MGNAFMPSVASSLNKAGQGSLLEVLQQRVLQAEMQKLLFQQQRQQGMDQFSMDMRLRGDQRDAERLRLAQEGAVESSKRAEATAARQAATDRRDANERGVAAMAADGIRQGTLTDRRDWQAMQLESGGKIPVSMLPREPVKKPTLEEKVAEATALTDAREKAKAKYKTGKGTKPAKDNPKAPQGFVTAISNRRGTTGFTNLKEAEASITSRWQDWRKNYPGLSLNTVRAALQDVYGERASGGGTDAIAQAVIAAINADKDDQ